VALFSEASPTQRLATAAYYRRNAGDSGALSGEVRQNIDDVCVKDTVGREKEGYFL
jgi:hypothetical protein